MSTQITLPSLGENIESGDVLSILVSEGDVVTKDQDLLELETDKATMPVPSPQAGKIVKVLVAEGDTVPVGGAIFEIEADGGSSNGATAKKEPEKKESAKAPEKKEEKPKAAPKKENIVEEEQLDEAVADQQEEPEEEPPAKKPAAKPAAKIAPAPESTPIVVEPDDAPAKSAKKSKSEGEAGDGQSSAAAGPAVRRLARELGVDLRRVRTTGDRITEEDVRNHVRRSQAESEAKAPKGVTPPGSPESDSYGAVRREKMTRMRQTIARNMLASHTTIPQLTNFDDVDVTDLERIRKESQRDYDSQGVKLTTLPFLVKALAVALRNHPIINASVGEEGNEIIYKEYVNIGIAVDTEKGLLVPVLRDADRKNIPQIARELVEIAASARKGTFKVEDLRGGTFTISNLGAIGGTYSTPIINPPEAAILLIGRSRMLPQWIDGAFQPRLMMPLSISYDHRIVDGATAQRFLNDVKGYLASPGRLLLAP
ncbi:2-oxo acid dehydrogenase subunit E2 [Lacipirellula limnantheis]|uniref:Dihydrolipoamide acetyltransferase component of pyruvate dehydrogenase complex n=1 Tax=Lacipirellula limnantheis TaxID=2528024 RepID=A0A517U696_9BACT|nr:2-oxo acid dehydrogenase subunit E2 [Lacipirellula limnantheis]QDT76152.1 Dihydrolipoyllysine-residue acetyltransferase component of pyruvate dehydrogenase complex [Lacipirellula limnantheis]